MERADFRIQTGFFEHYKTGRLIQALGYEGVFALLHLWGWVTEHKPNGCLDKMTADDIEFVISWHGERGKFVSTLVDVGWLDVQQDETFCIHDWAEHNPWAAGAQVRADVGRMGKLASNYPEIHAKYAAAGIRAISKKEYEQEIQAYKMRSMGTAPLPSTLPSLPLAVEDPIIIEDPIPQPSLSNSTDQALGNSGDPSGVPSGVSSGVTCAPSPEPINKKDLDQDQSQPQNQPVPTLQPKNTKDATSLPEVKLYLQPGEVEEIPACLIPEGMTLEEVRTIRQEIRANPSFSTLPPYIKATNLRTKPFIIAKEQKRTKEAQALPSTPQPKPTPQTDAGDLASLVQTIKKLYRAFPGYRPTKNEDAWITTLCQQGGSDTDAMIKDALTWTRKRNISVNNARGFISKWVKRVLNERKEADPNGGTPNNACAGITNSL